jgi:predicted extracellular nuclease
MTRLSINKYQIIFVYYLSCVLAFYPKITYAADEVVVSIVSQNLNRFFDDKDDGLKEKVISTRKYQQRLHKLVNKIAGEFKFANVIALQEIENIDILQQASELLLEQHNQHYQPYLIEGNDSSGIDVGYLIKQKFQVKKPQSLFKDQTFGDNQEKLFSRPPLLIEICQNQCMTLMNLHLKSMRGLRSPKKGSKVALKRRLQAETIARWINQFQNDHASRHLIVVGDFNALTPSDSYVDSVGTILGKPDQQRPRWTSPDLIDRDLIDSSSRVKTDKRYSYLYKKKRQQLDYLLMTSNLQKKIESLQFSRIDFSFSDHAALLARFRLD